jgi:hypothetical protein
VGGIVFMCVLAPSLFDTCIGLLLMGFKPRDRLKRTYNVKNCLFLQPDETVALILFAFLPLKKIKISFDVYNNYINILISVRVIFLETGA